MPSEAERPGVTGRLNLDQRRTLIVPALGTLDMHLAGREIPYSPVPHTYKTIVSPSRWRILLKFGAEAQRQVVGLDMYGDLVLGRGADMPGSPDIDLSNLNAEQVGVSRRHAMIRSGRSKLYLIDLGSTNGTYVNGIPVSKGMAQVLRGNDSISLAGLSMIIEIVKSPSDFENMPSEESNGISPTTMKVGENKKPKVGTETIVPGVIPFSLGSIQSPPEETARHKPIAPSTPKAPGDPDGSEADHS
jgi:hypothetical protein